MNRTVLFALLGLSLAGNVWFLLAAPVSPRSPKSSASAALAASAASDAATTVSPVKSAAVNAAPAATASAPAAKGLVWRTPKTDDDYRALAADLRAAGVPPRLIYTVLSDLYRQQAMADSPLAKASYWQRRATESSKEMQEIYRQLGQKIENLLGDTASPAARQNSVTRARRYGDLPAAKVDAIAQIELDYQEMQGDIYRATGPGAFTSEEWAAQRKQTDLLKAELRADLAKVLTPAELEAYELRNSDTARQLASSVREVTLSADEFAALYAARKTLEAATPPLSGMISMEQAAQRRAAQAAYFDAARSVLPEDRFYQLLAANESDYRAVASLGAQFAQVTPASSYQVWRLKNEIEQTRSTLFRSQPSGEAVQAAYADWNARLESLVGAPAAEAYRKTSSGRTFNAPTIRRATPAPNANPPRG